MNALPGRVRAAIDLNPGCWVWVTVPYGQWALVTKVRRVDIVGVAHLQFTVSGSGGNRDLRPVPAAEQMRICTRPEARAAGLSLLDDL